MLNFFLGAILIIGIFTRIDMMAQKISPHDLGKSFKLIETFDLLDEELSQTTFTETNKLFITWCYAQAIDFKLINSLNAAFKAWL